MAKNFDVIIIGGGPAGIFAALELMNQKPEIKVLLIEKGRDIHQRKCPMSGNNIPCINCKPCSIMNGWGGAGAFSDGKLTLTTEYGGWLDEYIGRGNLENLIKYVDDIYLKFGATTTTYGSYDEKVAEFERMAAVASLKLIPAEIRHLGTEKNFEILVKMREFLNDKITVMTQTIVNEILVEDGIATGVKLQDGQAFFAPYVVAVPGREGAEWFKQELGRLKLPIANNQVDIGVRVEVPASTLEHFTKHIYESKLVYYSKTFDDAVRTFCMNPYGHVVMENSSGLVTVNGHSYAESKSQNTNFALLVSKNFTEPFKEPIAYGKYIASLANMLGEGVIVQKLGDLRRGRRSNKERLARGLVRPTLQGATPGDLSLVLPYRYLVNITEMLDALDKVAPGVASDHTLLYGVEVKFYSVRPELSSNLETKIQNLFAAGDGAGVTRGLAQASCSGVLVAQEIIARMS